VRYLSAVVSKLKLNVHWPNPPFAPRPIRTHCGVIRADGSTRVYFVSEPNKRAQEAITWQVVFNTNVQSIEKPPGAGSSFQIRTSSSSSNASSTTFSHYKCKYTIMANGLSEPKKLKPDKEAVIFGYESMPMDKAWYNGKSVYILGAGNSALETALHIERCCVLCCAVCVFLQRAA
jgi:thioredoxin reductase